MFQRSNFWALESIKYCFSLRKRDVLKSEFGPNQHCRFSKPRRCTRSVWRRSTQAKDTATCSTKSASWDRDFIKGMIIVGSASTACQNHEIIYHCTFIISKYTLVITFITAIWRRKGAKRNSCSLAWSISTKDTKLATASIPSSWKNKLDFSNTGCSQCFIDSCNHSRNASSWSRISRAANIPGFNGHSHNAVISSRFLSPPTGKNN